MYLFVGSMERQCGWCYERGKATAFVICLAAFVQIFKGVSARVFKRRLNWWQ